MTTITTGTLRMVALLACLGAAQGTAQTTWIVDASGGPGTFTTIQAALDAAAHGDTILVRPGTYRESPATSKGVRIAADPGAVISTLSAPAFAVTDVAAGRTFVLRGMQFSTLGRVAALRCAGQVHLEDIGLPPAAYTTNEVHVADCRQVTVTALDAIGLPVVRIERSEVVLMDCRIRAAPWITSRPALAVDSSDVTVVGGAITGGPGGVALASPAIDLVTGTLTLAGRDTVVAAGPDGSGQPVSAVRAAAGAVVMDPAVTLVTRGGAPAVAGAASVVVRRVPSVRADGLASAATWAVDLHAPTGAPYWLFASVPIASVPTPWGDLWFDPQAHLVLACGAIGPGDAVMLNLPLPTLPRALPVVAQAAVLLTAGPELSTPAVNTVQ